MSFADHTQTWVFTGTGTNTYTYDTNAYSLDGVSYGAQTDTFLFEVNWLNGNTYGIMGYFKGYYVFEGGSTFQLITSTVPVSVGYSTGLTVSAIGTNMRVTIVNFGYTTYNVIKANVLVGH